MASGSADGDVGRLGSNLRSWSAIVLELAGLVGGVVGNCVEDGLGQGSGVGSGYGIG